MNKSSEKGGDIQPRGCYGKLSKKKKKKKKATLLYYKTQPRILKSLHGAMDDVLVHNPIEWTSFYNATLPYRWEENGDLNRYVIKFWIPTL